MYTCVSTTERLQHSRGLLPLPPSQYFSPKVTAVLPSITGEWLRDILLSSQRLRLRTAQNTESSDIFRLLGMPFTLNKHYFWLTADEHLLNFFFFYVFPL